VSTEDRFTLDHPLPLFLSGGADLSGRADFFGHADEHEERDGSVLLLNASVVVLVASLVGMAVLLSFGNPSKVFADIEASLTDISAPQSSAVQSTPTTQSTADVKVLPPTGLAAPARGEIATTSDAAQQSQAEIKAATAGALLNQFQDWATREDARAHVETVPPAQDARAQVLRNAQARVLRSKKH
jgi:hypothetical protein